MYIYMYIYIYIYIYIYMNSTDLSVFDCRRNFLLRLLRIHSHIFI